MSHSSRSKRMHPWTTSEQPVRRFPRLPPRELRRDLRDGGVNRQLLGSGPGYKLRGRRFASVFFRRGGSSVGIGVSRSRPITDRYTRRRWHARLTRFRALVVGSAIHASRSTVTSIGVIVVCRGAKARYGCGIRERVAREMAGKCVEQRDREGKGERRGTEVKERDPGRVLFLGITRQRVRSGAARRPADGEWPARFQLSP